MDAYWIGLRTFSHATPAPGVYGGPVIDDCWRIRSVVGFAGYDCEVTVTDVRFRRSMCNVWMDWIGERDPVVGLPFQQNRFEAESEWYVRPWRDATLLTFIWRIRSEPRRRQRRVRYELRRLGWCGMAGLKRELEGSR